MHINTLQMVLENVLWGKFATLSQTNVHLCESDATVCNLVLQSKQGTLTSHFQIQHTTFYWWVISWVCWVEPAWNCTFSGSVKTAWGFSQTMTKHKVLPLLWKRKNHLNLITTFTSAFIDNSTDNTTAGLPSAQLIGVNSIHLASQVLFSQLISWQEQKPAGLCVLTTELKTSAIPVFILHWKPNVLCTNQSIHSLITAAFMTLLLFQVMILYYK